MKRLSVISAFLMCQLAFAAMAGAAVKSPTDIFKTKNDKLNTLAKDVDKNEKQILALIGQILDFGQLSKDSLGKHWDGQKDEAKRKVFSDTLRSLIEKNLLERFRKAKGKQQKVTYDSEKLDGDFATVVTTVADANDPRAEKTQIAYKLRKNGNDWVAVDMITDDESLVENYRSQFNKIIADEGWDKLISKMKDKLGETPK